MHEALHYEKLENGRVKCALCPHNCSIGEGKRGTCGVRENKKGTLVSLVYSKPCAMHVDPIEKKPLYHFLPGSRSFSIGTAGCNLQCMHCQNWNLSRTKPESIACPVIDPDEITAMASKYGCASISYTYNEPSMNYEFVLETARKAHGKGIRNVMVTNGYISPGPLEELYAHIDAANVDLKAFSDDFYRKICKGRLEPVLQTLKKLSSMDVWVEITNLLIPRHNDGSDEIERMCRWIMENLGADHPVHFSAFHPDYKLTDVPSTPVSTLMRAREIALKAGLAYVYLGNVRSETPTACPRCGSVLISRTIFEVNENRITGGRCACGNEIPGVWE